MDDPLRNTLLQILQPDPAGGDYLVYGFITLLLFLGALTLFSAFERITRTASTECIETIEHKYGQALLALRLRNSRRFLATFSLAKYFCLAGLCLFCFYLITKFQGTEPGWSTLLFSVLASLPLLFLSFIGSRALVARYGESLLRRLSIPVIFLDYILLPFTVIYHLASRLSDRKIKLQQETISMDELSDALDLSKDSQTNHEEHKMLKGIINFGNIDINRIMKPKMDIVAFDFHTPYTRLIPAIMDAGYSRIPVYRDTLDNIVGVLYIKDLLAYLNEKDDFNWQALLRPCFFVPENKKPDDLMREFQHKKTHLAIVVDEFGQTTGLVTLEDIIEEIVGEINDEFDDEEIAYSKLDDFNYVFEGKTSMNDFMRIIGLNEEILNDLKSDADTLSGFIIERAGRFPKKNEKVNWENFTFSIESADSRRIKRVKVTIRKKQVPS